MKKRIWSLILALCMLIMLVPSSVSADETDYKEIYFDFLKDELITKDNSNCWTGATLADLNLDGTPELIMYDGGAVSTYGLHILQIIDNKPQLRYEAIPRNSDYANKDYFELNINVDNLMGRYPDDEYFDRTFSLRKNKYTDELMYVHKSLANEMESYIATLLCFSKDNIFTFSKKFCEDIVANETIISADYYIDGNTVSKQDYDTSYNEFWDTWQDTGYELSVLRWDWKDSTLEKKIRDFLDYYVPEKQFLGITDEDDTDKYGYVDVMPISRQEYDDRYEIKVSYKNNSSETITNKRIVLACTTLTNSKTKHQSEVVAAYKDSEDVFNPYEEKIVTTRIHCKKTADGIPYVIGDKPFSSNYRRYHSFLDDMTLITVQFANDKEYNDFMAEIEANHLTDLSTDEYIESNSMWLKTFKGDK